MEFSKYDPLYITVDVYLSLMEFAFAKQKEPELRRKTRTPETSRTFGYCSLAQKISVPGTLPNSSMSDLIELRINLPKETPTCISYTFIIGHSYVNS